MPIITVFAAGRYLKALNKLTQCNLGIVITEACAKIKEMELPSTGYRVNFCEVSEYQAFGIDQLPTTSIVIDKIFPHAKRDKKCLDALARVAGEVFVNFTPRPNKLDTDIFCHAVTLNGQTGYWCSDEKIMEKYHEINRHISNDSVFEDSDLSHEDPRHVP